MASFGNKGPKREPGERKRRKRLKREAKARLQAEQDPLATRARLSKLVTLGTDLFRNRFEHLSSSETWTLEGLINRTREAFELLRDELEKPGGEITWEEPYLELRFDVSIDSIDGPQPDLPPSFHRSGSFTDEDLRGLFEAAKSGKLEESPLLKKVLEDVEDFTQSALQLVAFKTLTGGTALLMEGEEYTPVLLKEAVDELPEDPGERRAAVDKLLEERCQPFVLSGPGEDGPTVSFTGEVDGKPFSCSLGIELHPLVIDVEKQEAFYPLLVALVFDGETPSTWSEEDRRELWAAVHKALDELEAIFRKATGPKRSETGTLETEGVRITQVAVEVLRTNPAKPSPGTLRRSAMGQFPVPRAFGKEADGWAFHRGLSRLFSGYSKVPDLDLNGTAATAEAERLFWPILEDRLKEAAVPWSRNEEDGRTVLILSGLQEPEARAFWKTATRSMNKGEGGPGLEVADPGFEKANRFDHRNGTVIVETRLVLWPETALVDRFGERTAPVRFRSEGSPGYEAMLERQGPRPYFADGWLWMPRGGEREGFRLGGLQTLLFPEGRQALERLAERDKAHLSERLNRIYREPSLFKSDDAQAAQDLKTAIRRVESWLRKLTIYDKGPDLLFCIYEAFYRQRDAWALEKLILKDGRVIETGPYRVIRLDAEDLRVRLDPGRTWGSNWRARLFDKLEALTTFERQTRIGGRKVEVGDRFLTRALDGLRGVQAGDAPETDAGLGLTRLLRQAGAFPIDAFFVEVSVDFMARLLTWAADEKGKVRWGLEAAQAVQRAALVSGRVDEKAAMRLGEETRRTVRSQPYYLFSSRLLTLGNLQGWPETRKLLARALLQEATPNFVRHLDAKGKARKRRKKNRLGGAHALESIDGKDFTACNGSSGYGYKVKTWLDKVGYEKRPGPGGGTRAFTDFLADLAGLDADVGLRMKLESLPGRDVLEALKTFKKNPPRAYDLKLKLYLPVDLECHLRKLLEEAGIDNPDDEKEPPRNGRLNPVDLRLARTRAGLKQGELGERLGVDQTLVSRWEAGKKPISLEQEAKLREILKDYLDPGTL